MDDVYDVYLNTTSNGIGLIIIGIYGNKVRDGIAWSFLKHFPSNEIRKQSCRFPDINYIDLEKSLYTVSKDFINYTAFCLNENYSINNTIMPVYNDIQKIDMDNPTELFSLCWHHKDLIDNVMGTISPNTKLHSILSYFKRIIPDYRERIKLIGGV